MKSPTTLWRLPLLAMLAPLFAPSAHAQTLFAEDFESGWNGWQTTNGVWQVGVPTSGPTTVPSGARVAATNLGGNHDPNFDAILKSPAIDLPVVGASEELRLRFQSWFSYAACDGGSVVVETYDFVNNVWNAPQSVGVGVVDTSPWSLQGEDLTAFAGERVRVGFSHSANSVSGGCGSTSLGWYIDDVSVERVTPVLTGDFENGWEGWSSNRGVWQVGTPTAGPGGAYTGQGAAGTRLDANHDFNTDSSLISPTFELPQVSGAEELSLRFRQWFSYAACDSGWIQISTYHSGSNTWSAFVTLGESVIDTSPWSLRSVDLTDFAGERVRVAFYHSANSVSGGCGSTSTGWYIDDVEVVQGAPLFTGDFENGWGDWSADRGVWQVGAPTSGPNAAFSGQGVAGTGLSGAHDANTDTRLISPSLDLPTVSAPQELSLRFQQWFSYSACDSGWVQISTYDTGTNTWSAFTTLDESVVDTSAWSRKSVDLGGFAGQRVRLAFYHSANSVSGGCGGTSTGWYIDEVTIVQGTPLFTGDFENGWEDWSADRGVWQVGAPTAGPNGAFSGQGLAGTALNSNHDANTDTRLISPTLDLPTVSGAEELGVRFRQWFSYSACDSGWVQLSSYSFATDTWSPFITLDESVVDTSPWSLKRVDLTSFAGQRVRLGFYHSANSVSGGCGGTSTGWYIDDVEIVQGVPLFTGDFESGWGDWSADRGVWQVGTPTTGPLAAFDGQGAAGTALDANHDANTDTRLVSPSLDLPTVSGAEELSVRFREWYSYSACDSGWVQVSTYNPGTGDWSAWTTVGTSITGSAGWTLRSVDLTAFAGERVRIALYHSANSVSGGCGGTGLGWYVDNVLVQRSVGSIYCTTDAVANSTGVPGTIQAFGSALAQDNRLDLFASNMAANQFGYFLGSQTQGLIYNAGGSPGTLCVVNLIARFNNPILLSSASGSFGQEIDLANIPLLPTHAVVAGETWNFQAWFRDGVNSSNFTDAVSIAFQ